MKNYRKRVPRFLLERRTLASSVMGIVLFSILFMVIYGPYSATSWLTVMVGYPEVGSTLGRFHEVLASVTFYLAAIAFLALSKVALHHVGHKWQLINAHLYAWIAGEVVAISLIYTVFTALFNLAMPEQFVTIWGRAVAVLSVIIAVPYTICALRAINKHQQQLLDRLGMNVVEDKAEENDTNLIHLTDSTGRLRMSIDADSLYYVESQDNYVKVYYDSEGKLCNYMLRSTTKAMETKFAHCLIRCHRGYLVNKNKIRVFCNDRDGMYIQLMHEGIRQIPVSKSYATHVQRMIARREES